jgi:glycosyltransferase involved in cell wall biosynthesis
LFPASLSTSNKGLVYLLHAVDVLLQRDANIRLQLAGPGDHTWALREAGASEQVVAALDVVGVGTLEDLPTRYAAAHVTALPSRDEAFGLVLLESLACGTPIVGGAVGGAQDIITDDRIGSLVPFGDHHALATALLAALKLAAEPTTTRNCRNHALHWNWSDHTGPAHETLYSELLHKRAR